MCHFSPLHFSASSLSTILPYRFRLQSYVHSLISLLLCAPLWQSRHNVIRFSLLCIRFRPVPPKTIWCMLAPRLPQYWHISLSRISTALTNALGIGFDIFSLPRDGRWGRCYPPPLFNLPCNAFIALVQTSSVISSTLLTL